MLSLPEIRISRPSFSFRFFIYSLFGLVLLALLVEGGYYFWIQKRTETQPKSPVIVREEGAFTYIKSPDGLNQKMILGTIEKIDGNLLTIKTDNNKIVQVLFAGEKLRIADLTYGIENIRSKNGTIEDLLIGDEVRVGDISSEDKGEITANFLAIIRGASE